MKRKNRLFISLAAAFFLFLFPGKGLCVHAGESVFEKDGEVFLIQSAQDMRTLALLVNRNREVEPGAPAHSASYRLTRDIDLSAYCTGKEGWEPIGYRDTEDESLEGLLWEKDEETGECKATDAGFFNGTFDGDNHVVTGLYVNRPHKVGQGLFGQRIDLMGEDPDSAAYRSREKTVIKNLYVKDCDVTGETAGGIMEGMVCWGVTDNGGLYIENCHVTGQISGTYATGGVAGDASCVKNSSFTGTVKAKNGAGIVSAAYYVSGCAVHATVQGSDEAGGISNTVWCVRDSYTAGEVSGNDCVGGIAGRGIYMSGCYSLAHVTGCDSTGGLVGSLESYPDVIHVMPEELVAAMPEDFLSDVTLKNCLMGEGRTVWAQPEEGKCEPLDRARLEETDFKELLGMPGAGKWSDVWFCAAGCAYPSLSWEKESRFGYTVTVTVQEGDSLWEIADAVYGNGHFWTQIYEENEERIGGDANLIVSGTDLEITVNASQADYAAKGDIWEQEKVFFERGREQGIAQTVLKTFFRRMLADDLWNGAVWEESEKRISNWVIDDLDKNGQADMAVMVGYGRGMVPGEIWLYWNGEPAYLLMDEAAYYEDVFCFGFGFWYVPEMGDFDNDGNQELLLEVFNGGNGGPGGRDICLFRRVGDEWVECLAEIPNEGGWPGEPGLDIDVTCIGVNRYEAYCPYLDESIEFDGQNSREIGEDEYGRSGGGNVWGFFGFERVTYKGKNALRCLEYLSGEGGNVHGVGEAVFILAWDADGVCRVADWWVEGWMH